MKKIKLYFRRILGILSNFASPSYGFCRRCWITWRFVEHHSIYIGGGIGIFHFCEHCWEESTDEEKMKHYGRLEDVKVEQWIDVMPDGEQIFREKIIE